MSPNLHFIKLRIPTEKRTSLYSARVLRTKTTHMLKHSNDTSWKASLRISWKSQPARFLGDPQIRARYDAVNACRDSNLCSLVRGKQVDRQDCPPYTLVTVKSGRLSAPIIHMHRSISVPCTKSPTIAYIAHKNTTQYLLWLTNTTRWCSPKKGPTPSVSASFACLLYDSVIKRTNNAARRFVSLQARSYYGTGGINRRQHDTNLMFTGPCIILIVE